MTSRCQRCHALLIAMLGVLVLAGPAQARTIAVSPDGSDAASGVSDAPVRTITRAAAMATGGDTVVVGAGRYAETVSLGSRHRGVVFRNAAGARPVIDGAGSRSYGFRGVGANRVTIQGFEITGQTEAGVYLDGDDGLVADNVIHHIGASRETYSNGIRLVLSNRSRATDNTIHHIGPGSESMGIWVLESRDVMVDDNTIYLVRKEGIRDWKGLDNQIRDNRVFLNWAGISLNTSTGSDVTNNYVYDNVEGMVIKHASYPKVLVYWGLTQGRWSRVRHNTVYRSNETSLWVAQSDEPLDYLEVRNNVWAGAGTAFVRDRPNLRGPNVVIDGNAYTNDGGRPSWIYKEGWSSDPGLNDWNAIRSATGWEGTGGSSALTLAEPQIGNLDVRGLFSGLALDSERGSQLGASNLQPAPARWIPYPMTAVDSSSKGTYYTKTHLQKSADGRQHSYWMTATGEDEYVTYDFGRQRSFDHLVLSVFAHFDKRNVRGYRFEVSDDRNSWRTVLDGTNPDSGGSANYYELPEVTTARYLRFTLKDAFCASYAPRSGCASSFVLSDLRAGLLTTGEGLDPASPAPTPADPGVDVPAIPTPVAGRPARPGAPAPAPRSPAAPKRHGKAAPAARVRTRAFTIGREAVLTRRGRLRIPLRAGHPGSIRVSGISGRGRAAARGVMLARRSFRASRGTLELKLRAATLRRIRARRVIRIRVVVSAGARSAGRVLRVRRTRR